MNFEMLAQTLALYFAKQNAMERTIMKYPDFRKIYLAEFKVELQAIKGKYEDIDKLLEDIESISGTGVPQQS